MLVNKSLESTSYTVKVAAENNKISGQAFNVVLTATLLK